MAENLWGDIPKPADMRLPVAILREQADLIFTLTEGLIKGRVSTSVSSGVPQASLSLVVPSMNDYAYNLATVLTNPVSIYPAQIIAAGDNTYKMVTDEDAFMVALGKILGSERTRKALNGLMAQAKAAEQAK